MTYTATLEQADALLRIVGCMVLLALPNIAASHAVASLAESYEFEQLRSEDPLPLPSARRIVTGLTIAGRDRASIALEEVSAR